MEDKKITEKKFSIIQRMKSFTHALDGLVVFYKTTPNAWIQTIIFICVIIMGFYFNITHDEWAMLVFACGLVIMAEAFNTAIEIDIDLTSPNFHPYARDTKDVAAGAVLIAAITSVIIAIFIFGPYVWAIMK